MIDLKRHIIDGTGCGPESFTESVEMCRTAAANGVHTIVATPLWPAESQEPPLPFAVCERKLEQLERETGGSISFKLGFNIMFRTDLPELLDRYGSALALGGRRYLLVSLPSLSKPAETEKVWSEIAERDFSVIIARPECNLSLRRQPHVLEQWVREGVRLQIDAASITGTHGREVQRFALQLARLYARNAVVASNSRNAKRHNSILLEAHQELVKTTGSHHARLLFNDIPAEIIGLDEGESRGRQTRPRKESLISRLRSFRRSKPLPNES